MQFRRLLLILTMVALPLVAPQSSTTVVIHPSPDPPPPGVCPILPAPAFNIWDPRSTYDHVQPIGSLVFDVVRGIWEMPLLFGSGHRATLFVFRQGIWFGPQTSKCDDLRYWTGFVMNTDRNDVDVLALASVKQDIFYLAIWYPFFINFDCSLELSKVDPTSWNAFYCLGCPPRPAVLNFGPGDC